MAARETDITHEFRFFRVYKDGTVELYHPTVEKIPPFDDPVTGVRSKDTIISTDPPVSVRIFLPRIINPTRKLPLLLYMHGGGFCMQSAFSPTYHNLVSTIVAEANIIAVSVEYGLFPTRPMPACYDDSWAALQWIASHVGGSGPESWLNKHADLQRVFIAGDSAGGNITHTLISRVGKIGLPGVNVVGAVLVHPYFAGTEYDDEMWMYMCPGNEGWEDPRMKPAVEDLARLGCERVLVFAAEKDHLFNCGRNYVKELNKSGWSGSAELVENWGLEHCFHIFNPQHNKAPELLHNFVSFILREGLKRCSIIVFDDPFINPEKEPNLGRLGCDRVLVCVAENDLLKDRGWYYKELLEKSGWHGVVEVMEAKGEGHVFHLFNPSCENALSLLNRFASFINQS